MRNGRIKAIDLMYYVATPEFIAKWNKAKEGENEKKAKVPGANPNRPASSSIHPEGKDLCREFSTVS